MPCLYGNCNDANCVAGSDSDVNGNPCDDPSCPPCNASATNLGGAAVSTVTPSPLVPSTATSSIGAGSQVTQMGNVFGQWGATIAGIVTGQPTVSGPSGVRVGAAAITPAQNLTSSGIGTVLLLVAVVAVIVIVAKK